MSEILELQIEDFRVLLKQELMRRCERNPRYSLRAFASTLQISHATLSHILAGRRRLTARMIQKIGAAMGLSPNELEKYIMTSQNKVVFHRPDVYQELTHDSFVAISEWYHDAIMELTHLKNFKPDPKWIARVLGITVTEVNLAIERLQKLELLEIKDGVWTDQSKCNTTTLDPSFTSAALRKYQKKILELSLQALEQVPKSEREHVSNMLSIDAMDVAEVKKRITRFRWQLAGFLQRKNKQPDQVYQLAISFFPIALPEKLGDVS